MPRVAAEGTDDSIETKETDEEASDAPEPSVAHMDAALHSHTGVTPLAEPSTTADIMDTSDALPAFVFTDVPPELKAALAQAPPSEEPTEPRETPVHASEPAEDSSVSSRGVGTPDAPRDPVESPFLYVPLEPESAIDEAVARASSDAPPAPEEPPREPERAETRSEPQRSEPEASAFRPVIEDAVDPIAGVVHEIGDRVELCAQCQTAYTPESLAALVRYGNQCTTCGQRFGLTPPLPGMVGPDGRFAAVPSSWLDRHVPPAEPEIEEVEAEWTPAPGGPRFRRSDGMVDPVTGSRHPPGTAVMECPCGAAYRPASLHQLLARSGRCMICGIDLDEVQIRETRVPGRARAARPSAQVSGRSSGGYRVGDRVVHEFYGNGTVLSVTPVREGGSMITCDFERRDRSVRILEDHEGLRRAS